MILWHLADAENRMYCNLTDGKKISMPRYYKQKIYDDDTRKAIGEVAFYKMRLRNLSKEKPCMEKQRAIIELSRIRAFKKANGNSI